LLTFWMTSQWQLLNYHQCRIHLADFLSLCKYLGVPIRGLSFAGIELGTFGFTHNSAICYQRIRLRNLSHLRKKVIQSSNGLLNLVLHVLWSCHVMPCYDGLFILLNASKRPSILFAFTLSHSAIYKAR
jgi:hypothetical protein